MSFMSPQSTEHTRLPKRRIQRRHGACEPCRTSKTKCDGRTPCGACRSERRRQCPCVYSEKVMKLQQVTADMHRRAEQERLNHESFAHQPPTHHSEKAAPVVPPTESQAQGGSSLPGPSISQSVAGVKDEVSDHETILSFAPLSLCGTIEEFKKLKPTRGSASQVVGRCDGFEAVDISASALSAMPNLEAASDRRLQIPDLTTSRKEISMLKDRLDAIWTTVTQGRLKRAWVGLASLVREAELFDSSDALNDLSIEDRNSWKRLCVNILDLESQLGIALGRPTCLVLPRQDSSKSTTTADGTEDPELDATRLDLFKHIQSALALDCGSPNISSEFHDKAESIIMNESFNKVCLCTTEKSSASARDLQMNTHLLFMVIYCRLASMWDVHARKGITPIFVGSETNDAIRSLGLNEPRQKLKYCRMMFKSAKFVVSVFLNLISDDKPDVVAQNWMRCHGALIAATLLGIAKLRHEVEWESTTELLRKLEHAFSDLSLTSPDCKLFKVAIGRLRDLNSVEEPTSEITRNKHSGIKHRKRHATSSTEASPSSYREKFATGEAVQETEPLSRSLKRNRDQMEAATQLSQSLITSFNSSFTSDDDTSPLQASNTSFIGSIDPMSFYQDSPSLYSQTTGFSSNTTTSTATSFCESEAGLTTMPDMTLTHPGPPFAYPFPINLVHPPMMLFNPAMLANDQVLVSSAGGSHYFHPATNIGPSHAPVDQLNTFTQSQNRDGNIHGIVSGVNGSPQNFHDARCQGHARDSNNEQKSVHLTSSPTHVSDIAERPGMERQRSTETILLAPSAVPTPSQNSWQTHDSKIAARDVQGQLHRVTSADIAGQAQLHHEEPPSEGFYVSLSMPQSSAAQSMYQHSQQLPNATAHPYFDNGVPSGSDRDHEVSHFRHNCSFSCTQQHYVHGPDQWRQMSVNAGVPGGS